MVNLPDPPWIQDAERNGIGYDEKVYYCPQCNEESPEYFYICDGFVLGCSGCISKVDSEDFAHNHPEEVLWEAE